MKNPKSKKARKQRKFLYNAPIHLKRKMLSSHLSKSLREKYKKRSMPIRKGDEVLIMRGKFKGRTGKISRVDLRKNFAYIDGVVRKRTVGTDVQVPFHTSNLQITNLNLGDKRRVKILERKGVKVG
jgi:large subunit ribosomal protein L24